MSWPILLALAVALLVANFFYLFWYFRWEARQTTGLAYFGRTSSDRRALKRRIRLYSLPALPLARLLSPLARRQPGLPSFVFEGVAGPVKASSPEVFSKAKQYQPKPEDVFVATQMRCGTTWMQQVVYQIVTRGRGEFRDDGFRHLYAISPWIDAVNSVSMEAAPLVGIASGPNHQDTPSGGAVSVRRSGEVHLRRAASRELLRQHRRLQPVDGRAVPAADERSRGLVLQRSDVLAPVAAPRRRLVAVGPRRGQTCCSCTSRR